MARNALGLRVGELVEVRSYSEIAVTLDERGRLDGLPFMPEMVKHCGKRFTVHGRAERTCVETHRARGMDHTVWLKDARCTGEGHDSCTIGCLIFWKEAWLKRVKPTDQQSPSDVPVDMNFPYPTKDVVTGRYLCHSSELYEATYPLGLWGNIRSYLRDIYFRNLSIPRFLKVAFIYLNLKIRGRYGDIVPMRGDKTKTPAESLDLQPGDWVEVKSPQEILETLDSSGRNRGLAFQPEFVEYSRGHFQVLRRADHFIDESTGQMRNPKNTVILKDVVCTGTCRRGCVRNGLLLWREIWLRKIDPAAGSRHVAGDGGMNDA